VKKIHQLHLPSSASTIVYPDRVFLWKTTCGNSYGLMVRSLGWWKGHLLEAYRFFPWKIAGSCKGTDSEQLWTFIRLHVQSLPVHCPLK
jgi:hypothetical protein